MQRVPRTLTNKADIADLLEMRLRQSIMPYWYGKCDFANGGYVVADTQRTRWTRLRDGVRHKDVPAIREKLIVSQARLLYVFSLIHQLGYADPTRDYLKAAELGYRFMLSFLFDREHKAFNWKTDDKGGVQDARKFLCAQAIAVYALVEYHRATRLEEPLDLAVQVFRAVDEKMRDRANMGWMEQADADFKPLRPTGMGPNRDVIGVIGLKSGNAHMHWMEALSELYAVTGDAIIKDRLEETLKIGVQVFFPPNLASGCQYCTPDWKAKTGAEFDEISYGHAIEFAWLMIRAQQVLQFRPGWDHFESITKYCLKFGFDYKRGGFYNRGYADQPAFDTTKVWWVQAEGLAALSDGWEHRADPEYEEPIDLLLSWIMNHQMLPDGIWIGSTDVAGNWRDRTKASGWKAAYHEVRATTKFIKTFSQPVAAATPAHPRGQME